MISRRGFLTGIGAALAAPAIVKAEFLMPVKQIIMPESKRFLTQQLIVEDHDIVEMSLWESDDGLLWSKIKGLEKITNALLGDPIKVQIQKLYR